MDSRTLRRYLDKTFGAEFKARHIQSVGSTYFYAPFEWLLKGLSFDKSGNNLYVTWFMMPLFPKSDSIILTYGDRIVKEDGSSIFDLEDEEVLTQTLYPLLLEKLAFLDKYECIHDFYAYFYEEDNLSQLSQIWLASDLRLKETDIYCRAFMELDYGAELEVLLAALNENEEEATSWQAKMKNSIHKLIQASESSEMINFFDAQRAESIQCLKLEDFLHQDT